MKPVNELRRSAADPEQQEAGDEGRCPKQILNLL
jgi:hypothetical protein